MSRGGASAQQIQATKLVLIEVAKVFAGYKGVVLVGGNVPSLLMPHARSPHEGTIDIDIAIDPARLYGDPVLTLHEVLQRAGFSQDRWKAFRWNKTIEIEGERLSVLMELLCGGTVPPGGSRNIRNEDVVASAIPGLEAAFAQAVPVQLPDDQGSLSSLRCRRSSR